MSPWFQPAAAVTLAVAYVLAFSRPSLEGEAGHGRKRRALECLVIAVAAWIGEESCIRLYGFYEYAAWTPMLSRMPLLVVAIWPMVVQSARTVALELLDRPSPALVALVVLVDASLMEVIAVASGLWKWVEPGYLEVPIIGVLGWVFFSTAIAMGFARARGLGGLILSGLAAIVATHALLVATWWGALRWVLRGDLGPWAVVGFAPFAVALLVIGLRSGRTLAPRTVVARVAASSVFFVLLFELRDAPRFSALVAHTAIVAVPYLAASMPRRFAAMSRRGAKRTWNEPPGPDV